MPSVDEFLNFVVSHVCDGDQFTDATQKAWNEGAKHLAQRGFTHFFSSRLSSNGR